MRATSRKSNSSTGSKPGQLTAALDGEPVGTIIFNDAAAREAAA